MILRVADHVTESGDLTLKVKMALSSKVVEQKTAKIRMLPRSMEKGQTLVRDVSKARNEDVLNDVTIKCGFSSIPCSKFILCSR